MTTTEAAHTAPSLAFGTAFTGHMVTMTWTEGEGWHDLVLEPHRQILIDPAMVGLHYGQVVFEGLKAHRMPDGDVAVFRPEAHAARLRSSARRLMMPELPDEHFLAAVDALVGADEAAVPDAPGLSLYLRPIIFASERTLALRPAREYRFILLAFVTEGYFGSSRRPVRVWVTEEYSRAAPGGTGAAKCAGNYAGAMLAQESAHLQDCDQVVWLDPVERHWVEEMGGMNLFFVFGSGPDARLVTPPLSGNLLPGVTRASILTIAADLGIEASEEMVSLEDWRKGCRSGEITEVFACGTAARVSPVNEVKTSGDSWVIGGGRLCGDVTTRIAEVLTAIQTGGAEDGRGWLRTIASASGKA